MDDLWGNAWGSPEDDAKPTTWAISEKPKNDDLQEDDLAMPSWSTGPGIQWDEPSDTQSSLWSNANAHHVAQERPLENSYGDIPLGNSRLAEPEGDNNSTVELPVEPEAYSFSPPSPRAERDDITAASPSREPDRELSLSPTPSPSPSPEPSPSSSLDAFGTFTIGAEHSDAAPIPTLGGPLGGRIDDNEWGSPWGSVSKDAEEKGAQVVASDEWESAKLRQLEMDRRVPPELLSQILLHLEDVSKDVWPETQDAAEEDWQRRCRSGMDIDGLDSLLLRYVPVLTLPQLLPSGKTFTAKAMADAVKLSRNTALARTSPMSILLGAKGSTAWETSVKSRTEKPVDEVPLGWRILEKDPKKDEKAEDRVKKPTGLLASFWSRKTASMPSSPASQERNNPSPDITAPPENTHPAQTLVKRPSVESVKITPVTVTPPETPPQPTSTPAPSQDEDAPPGSAVSRFLKRFSRPRLSSPSPRNSLALSGDDLEYLSDVRSNSNSTDLVDINIADRFTGLGGAGTESTQTGFLRGKLPPPLPPPPKVPTPGPLLNNTLNGHSLISPNDPHLKATTDLRNPPKDSTVSALTLLTPSPLNSTKSKPIPPNAALSHPLSPDKIAPSLIVPVSSSRPNSVMSTQPVAQPQLQASGNTANPFDISQDDDDFSDFRSSPPGPPLLPLNVSSLVTRQEKVDSTQSSQHQLNSPFDDLVHLMSSPTTGPPNTFEAPNTLLPLNFTNSTLPTAPTPPPLRESATHRVGLDRPNETPTHSRSNSQQSTSPSKAVPTSPKQKAITQGHQRTQSLLDLAAARRGRWPAPPSPLPEPLQPPPPPPGKGQVDGPTNADYFGFTPTEDSFNIPSLPAPPGKTSSLLPLPQADAPSKNSFPAPNLFDASPQPGPPSGPPPPLISPTPHTGMSTTRRTLSPPPLPAAIVNKSPSKSSTPVPLLPPPSGFRIASPAKGPPVPQIAPEPSPLALLMDSDAGKKIGLPGMKAKATPPPFPPPPVKGTGGLSAQDLSFFEGL